jgi:hypothetical protein
MAKPFKGAPPVAKPATEDKKAENAKKAAANHEKMLRNLVSLQKMFASNPEGTKEIIEMSKQKVSKTELQALVDEKKMSKPYFEWLTTETEICSKGRTSSGRVVREKVTRTYPKSFAVYHPTDEIGSVKGVTPERTVNKQMIEAGTEFHTNLAQFEKDNEHLFDIFEANGMFWSTYFRKGDPILPEKTK